MKRLLLITALLFCAVISYGQNYNIGTKYLNQIWSYGVGNKDSNTVAVFDKSVRMYSHNPLWFQYDSIYFKKLTSLGDTSVLAIAPDGGLFTIPPGGGGSGTNYWTLDGDSLSPNSNAYNVGIGTGNPGKHKFQVTGNMDNIFGTRHLMNDTVLGLPFTGAYKTDGAGYLFSGIIPYGIRTSFVGGYYKSVSDQQLIYSDSTYINIYSMSPLKKDTAFAGIHCMKGMRSVASSDAYETDLHLNANYGLDLSYKIFISNVVKSKRDLHIDSTGFDFQVKLFSGFSESALKIDSLKQITFNSQYTFPLTDGSANEVLTTDGGGNVTWQPGGAGVGYWTLDGDSLSPNSNAYNVGIGTGNTHGFKFYEHGQWQMNDDYVQWGNNLWAGVPFTGMYGRYANKETYLNGMLNLNAYGYRHKMIFGWVEDTTLYGFMHRRISLTADTINGLDLTVSRTVAHHPMGVHLSVDSLYASGIYEQDITMDLYKTDITSRRFNSLSQHNSNIFRLNRLGISFFKHPFTGSDIPLFSVDSVGNTRLIAPASAATDSVLVIDGGVIHSVSVGGGGLPADSVPFRQVSNSIYNKTSGSLLLNGATGATPTSGAGTRMMWIPAKASFYAGIVTGYQWDNAYVGLYNGVFGYNTISSGNYNLVGGYASYGSGSSVIIGGSTCNATADYTFSTGYGNTSEAICAWSGGEGMDVVSRACFGFGRYGVKTGTWNSWVSTDPLFYLGNGTGAGAGEHNAFTVFKDATIMVDSLLLKESTITTVDDGIVAAPTGIVGRGWVSVCSGTVVVEWADFYYDQDGTVHLIQNSANVVNTDIDGKFCIYDSGSGFSFRNRLAATYKIKYQLNY